MSLDARYLIKADAGTLIDVANRGCWIAGPDVGRRLDAGVPVSESEYHYRTSPVFIIDAEPHRWLTHSVFVGLASQEQGTICLRFFALD